jgi:hypothetical protein
MPSAFIRYFLEIQRLLRTRGLTNVFGKECQQILIEDRLPAIGEVRKTAVCNLEI